MTTTTQIINLKIEVKTFYRLSWCFEEKSIYSNNHETLNQAIEYANEWVFPSYEHRFIGIEKVTCQQIVK